MRKTKRSKTKRRNRKHNYLGKARIKYYSIKKGGNNLNLPRTITPNRTRTISRSFTKDNYWQRKKAREASEKARAAAQRAAMEAEWEADRRKPLGAVLLPLVAEVLRDNPKALAKYYKTR